jgi:hypothetical protein
MSDERKDRKAAKDEFRDVLTKRFEGDVGREKLLDAFERHFNRGYDRARDKLLVADKGQVLGLLHESIVQLGNAKSHLAKLAAVQGAQRAPILLQYAEGVGLGLGELMRIIEHLLVVRYSDSDTDTVAKHLKDALEALDVAEEGHHHRKLRRRVAKAAREHRKELTAAQQVIKKLLEKGFER